MVSVNLESLKKRVFFGVFGLALAAAMGCSGAQKGSPQEGEVLTVRQTAQRIITTDLESVIGKGELKAVCEEVFDVVVGREFKCSATGPADKVLYFAGKVEVDGRVSVATKNVLLEKDLPAFEQSAIAYVNNQLGQSYHANSMDCGDESVILTPDQVVGCRFIEPATGNFHDAEIKVNNLAQRSVIVKIAKEPRT